MNCMRTETVTGGSGTATLGLKRLVTGGMELATLEITGGVEMATLGSRGQITWRIRNGYHRLEED